MDSTRRSCKILATLGPSLWSEKKLRRAMEKGVDGFRFNFSHGDIEDYREVLKTIRRLSDELEKPVATLADLQGPKIRVGELEVDELNLEEEDEVWFYESSDSPPAHSPSVPISYSGLAEEVEPGEDVYINDGIIQIRVTARRENYLVGEVITGGVLWSRKGVNLPESELKVSALTGKDRRDLEEIMREDFDMVALSFVRRREDLQPVRELMEQSDRPVDLIAKIEHRQALENLESIIEAVEGVMVARGDLGVEISPQRVPFYQKKIIEEANKRGRNVITATQMLETMIHNPRPTRAETSDVSNAVIDGSDVVMLSGETAVGDYPLQVIETMDEIITATEKDFDRRAPVLTGENEDFSNRVAVSTCLSAARSSNQLDAAALIIPTFSGSTARLAANTDVKAPIIAMCPSKTALQKVSLYRNVRACSLEMIEDTDRLIKKAVEITRERGLASPGDLLVLLAGLPLPKAGVTNFMHIIEVEG